MEGRWYLFPFIEIIGVEMHLRCCCDDVNAAGTHDVLTLARPHTQSMHTRLRLTVYRSTHTVNSSLLQDQPTRSVTMHTSRQAPFIEYMTLIVAYLF